MSDAALLLALLAAMPVLVIAGSYLRLDLERLRSLAVASATAMLLAALVAAVAPPLRGFAIRSTALTRAAGG